MTQIIAPQVAANRSRRVAWLIFGGVVLLALAAGAWHFIPILGPMNAAQGYCDDLTHQRYADMYQQRLTAALRAQVSAQAFIGAEQLADEQAGVVTQCSPSPLAVTLNGGSAVAHVTAVRHGGLTIATDLHLNGASWQIAALPDPAIAPYGVVQQFCDALTAQHYDQAYQLLAPAITTSLTQTRYIALQQYADQTSGPVTTCAITQLALDATSATATAQVRRQHGPASGAGVQVQLGEAGGVWLIGNLPTA